MLFNNNATTITRTKSTNDFLFHHNRHLLNRDPWFYEFIVTYPPLPSLNEGIPNFFQEATTSKNISLYLHIPFCTNLCSFCGRFVKYIGQTHEQMVKYVNYLKKEIDYVHSITQGNNHKISSVYFGGGTPTVLPLDVLVELINYVLDKFNVDLQNEITVETSPEVSNKEIYNELIQSGVNRISIGIQSFDDNVLKLTNRAHDKLNAIYSFYNARKIGFENINIDLLLGLPNYDLTKFSFDLNQAVELKPDCITIYPLYIQESCTMYKMDRNRFPNAEVLWKMGIYERDFFKSVDYIESPIHYFTLNKNKTPQQWFHRWKNSGDVIGLGVSSFGFFNNTQYHNHLVLDKYYESIDNGQIPIWKFLTLDKEEQTRRKLIFQIKTGVIEKTLIKTSFRKIINNFIRLNLITDAGEYYELTLHGKVHSEEMCLEFFSPLVKQNVMNISPGYCGYMNKPALYY